MSGIKDRKILPRIQLFSPHFGTFSIYLCSMIITHYCRTLEDALKQAKKAAKQPGYDYWGKTFPDGRKGFEIFKYGNLVEKYVAKSVAR